MKSAIIIASISIFIPCLIWIPNPCVAKKDNDHESSSNNSTSLGRSKNKKDKTLISFPLLHHNHIIARRTLEANRNHLGDKNSNQNQQDRVQAPPPPPWGTVFQGYGTHYVDLWVGTPPQRQTVIIDTGSDITAFPCEECGSKCGKSYHIDDNYKHTESSTFQKLFCDFRVWNDDEEEVMELDDDYNGQCKVGTCRTIRRLNDETVCKVGVSYAEGSSWDAYEARDVVYLGGSHDAPLESSDDGHDGDNGEDRRMKRRRKAVRRATTVTSTTTHLRNRRSSRNNRNNSNSSSSSTIAVTNRNLDANEMDHKNDETQHNTIDLENEFKKEAQVVEEEYLEKHHHSHNDKDEENERNDENNEMEESTANDYSFLLSFGCQYKITGLFKTQLADGIMGMEQSEDSFWMQMYNANIIQSRMFALCFTLNNEVISREGTVAGSMTLGGTDARLHDSKMVYAQNDSEDGWYTVFITGMYLRRGDVDVEESSSDINGDESDSEEVGRKMEDLPELPTNYYGKYDDDDFQNDYEDEEEQEIGDIVKIDLNIHKLNSRGIILDSGTTDSYLPSFTHKYFQAAYKKIYGMTLDDALDKYTADEVDIKSFPTILIQLKKAKVTLDEDEEMYKDITMTNGDDHYGTAGSLELDERHPDDVVLEIPPYHYLSEEGNIYQQRFHLDDEDGFGILGANSMFGYDILFDVDNERIGFAKSDCDHTVLVNE